MKQNEKEENQEFVEEIVEEMPKKRRDPKKLISKMILGKKTILKRKIIPNPPPPPPIETQKTKSNAEILVESIVKTYWISKWKEQLLIMKYSRQNYNKKRGNFRNFCMKMNNAMKYHQYLYLAKLFDKMESLPKKENIIHDNFYGKLKFVKNDTDVNINKDMNNIIIKSEEKTENKINIPNIEANNKIEIKVNPPEIEEVEYKPEKEDKINIEGKNEIKNDMNIESNIDNIKDDEKVNIEGKK